MLAMVEYTKSDGPWLNRYACSLAFREGAPIPDTRPNARRPRLVTYLIGAEKCLNNAYVASQGRL